MTFGERTHRAGRMVGLVLAVISGLATLAVFQLVGWGLLSEGEVPDWPAIAVLAVAAIVGWPVAMWLLRADIRAFRENLRADDQQIDR